jgi:hypothetical protein
MKLKSKSRFRLTLEIYASVFIMLIGLSFGISLIGLLIAAPAVLYHQRIAGALKGRRESLTEKQKLVLFGIESSFCAIFVLGFLAIALWKQTALAWIIFALVSIVMLAALFGGYVNLYKDERVD